MPTNEGWLYLAAVKDLHTGEIGLSDEWAHDPIIGVRRATRHLLA